MRAKDLIEKLKSDSKYQEIWGRKEQEFAERRAVLVADEHDLIKELTEAGCEVESVWDFVNNNNRYEFLRCYEGSYKGAYSILVKHLTIPHHPTIREGIIRALTVRNANEVASKALLNEFYREQDSDLKWVLANALHTVLTRREKAKYPEYKKIYDAH